MKIDFLRPSTHISNQAWRPPPLGLPFPIVHSLHSQISPYAQAFSPFLLSCCCIKQAATPVSPLDRLKHTHISPTCNRYWSVRGDTPPLNQTPQAPPGRTVFCLSHLHGPSFAWSDRQGQPERQPGRRRPRSLESERTSTHN